jgi:hypothetical protein
MPPAVPRRPLTLAAAAGASLLVCVATAALWVRSYYVGDAVNLYDGRGRVWRLMSWKAGIDFFILPARQTRRFEYVTRPMDAPGGGRALHFRLSPGVVTVIVVPHWVLCLAFAGAGVLLLRVARRRDQIGLCPICGYDLRATPARCPECGAVPAAPAAR